MEYVLYVVFVIDHYNSNFKFGICLIRRAHNVHLFQ